MPSRRHLFVVVCVSLTLTFGPSSLRSDDQPEGHSARDGIVLTANGAQPEKHQLAFKFRSNQVLRYEVVNESEITDVPSQGQTSRSIRTPQRPAGIHRVAACDDKTGAADLELSIDWVYMRAIWDKRNGTTPTPIEFQSDDPEKHPAQFKHILATVGKPWATIRFKPTGNPLKISDDGRPAEPTARACAFKKPGPTARSKPT